LARQEKNAARAAQNEVDVLTLLSLEQLEELAPQSQALVEKRWRWRGRTA
jgi:hypothetical protein